MIELVIVACSILHGAQCKTIKETYLPSPGELPVWACAHNGQYHAIKWQIEHSNWSVRRWSCRPKNKIEAKA